MVKAQAGEGHRPGVWKQQNKGHKHGRHKSKGQIKTEQKGKVSMKVKVSKKRSSLGRKQRKNLAKQIRARKIEVESKTKAKLGSPGAPPILVAIVALSRDADALGFFTEFSRALEFAPPDVVVCSASPVRGDLHITLPKLKQQFTVMKPQEDGLGDLIGVLDAVKAANTLIFIHGDNGELFDDEGKAAVSAIRAQGLPTCVHILPKKQRGKTKRTLEEVADPDDRLAHFSGDEPSAMALLRIISTQKRRELNFRDHRPHLVADRLQFLPPAEGSTAGSLRISGFLRGTGLDQNKRVHIPDHGDFRIASVTIRRDPYSSRTAASVGSVEDTGEEIVITPDAAQETDDVEMSDNDAENEGDDAMTDVTSKKIGSAPAVRKRVRRLPKGISDYQAAWIVDSDEEDGGAENSSQPDDEDVAMSVEDGASTSASDDEEGSASDEEVEDGDAEETKSEFSSFADLGVREQMELLAKLKKARDDQMFPDEEDTPLDVPARQRYAKYRGLDSFRRSVWENPDADLPAHFRNLFRFADFRKSRKLALAAADSPSALIQPGMYVTVELENVSEDVYKRLIANERPIVVFGLLAHEDRMSVINCVIKRRPVDAMDHRSIPVVQSKDRLVFQVGFRRFTACPVFSEYGNGNKFKMERFWREGGTVVASFVAPVTFPPAPVLVWLPNQSNYDVLGAGRVMDADPGRIIVKRVVLSGYPYKIHGKHTAIIRFMFFNREDIAWFKPVRLRTKHGRRGHIQEAVGTHGYMKCVFDKKVKSEDTVLLTLYKRVFPKWSYEPMPIEPLETKSKTVENLEMAS